MRTSTEKFDPDTPADFNLRDMLGGLRVIAGLLCGLITFFFFLVSLQLWNTWLHSAGYRSVEVQFRVQPGGRTKRYDVRVVATGEQFITKQSFDSAEGTTTVLYNPNATSFLQDNRILFGSLETIHADVQYGVLLWTSGLIAFGTAAFLLLDLPEDRRPKSRRRPTKPR